MSRDLWGHTASTATKDHWEPGETAHYEYHCDTSPNSSDYHLYQRTHQPITVLGVDPDSDDFSDVLPTLADRAGEGLPRTYRVRFGDGHEDTAWEDEMLTGPQHFSPAWAFKGHTASRTAGKNHGLEDIEFVLGGHSGLYHPDTEYPHHRHLSTNAVHTPTGRTVAYMDRYNTGELYEIHVDPEFRRRGIATGLFDWTKNNIDPDTSHSPDMTDDGRAWSQSMGWNPRKYNPKQMGSLYDDHHTAARLAMPTWYHLTDDPDFTLDPHREPTHLNGPGGPGVFLTQRPEEWAYDVDGGPWEWSGDRPYVAEVDAPVGLHMLPGTWHDPDSRRDEDEMVGAEEVFVPGGQFHHLRVKNVRPRKARTMTAAVTVYTQPSCVQCDMTKRLLDRMRVEHTTVDVSTDPDAHAYVTGLGYASAPVVVVDGGGDHWAGFKPDRLRGLAG